MRSTLNYCIAGLAFTVVSCSTRIEGAPLAGESTESGSTTITAAQLINTTWYAPGDADNQGGCSNDNKVTFLADGTFNYKSRCHDEKTYRSYIGAEDNSTWKFADGRGVISFNDGYTVCDLTATANRELDAQCRNRVGKQFHRVYTQE